MNRTKLAKEIKDLQAQIKEKQKQLDSLPIRWRAEKGKFYYYINENFDVISTNEKNAYLDDVRYYRHNYFQTFEEAEAMAEKTKLMFEMTTRVKELNGNWVAAWEDEDVYKYGLTLNIKGEIAIDYSRRYNPYVFGLSVLLDKHAKILLAEFEERIEKWY